MLKFGLTAFVCIFAPLSVNAIEMKMETFDDTRVLILTGDFTAQDEPRTLASAIANFSPDLISFNSLGGNIYAAMAFGRIIRLHSVATIQFRSQECASACALAFLGGSQRYAEPGAIGVHKTSFIEGSGLSSGDAVSAIQSATADVLAYLVEMGVDPALLQLSLRYESWDVRYLSGSEMEQHRVVTTPWNGERTATATTSDENAQASRQTPSQPERKKAVRPEDAGHGIIRRPKGYANLMAEPSTAARELRVLENGVPVAILGTIDRWYRVAIDGGEQGWLHHTWLKVDEFYSGGFEAKHVQIKSFDDPSEVQVYLRESPLDLDVYMATNGWFAITLDGTFSEVEAARFLSSLKSQDRIPADSFQTYGNTYMEKLCCD
ncbi:SH3 domain-containing protein [bacterium]|nr:SH3 domain-containing protein [bacterium]